MLIIIIAFLVMTGLLVWYLLTHDHGRKMPAKALWAAAGFGLLGIAAALFLEFRLLPDGFDTENVHNIQLGWGLLFFLVVGVIEEACKFGPLAAWIYKKPYFNEHIDGIVIFAICGLTFGLLENIAYTLEYGASAGISRLVLTPFFHAAGTGILGYYLVSMKINPRHKTKFWLAPPAVMALHGIYDYGLYSQIPLLLMASLMITLLFSLGLFLYYMEANDLDKVAERVKANDNFCPHCGRPNLKHKAFCTYCGRHL